MYPGTRSMIKNEKWWCVQSAANSSLALFSLIYGKIQGKQWKCNHFSQSPAKKTTQLQQVSDEIP
jgi:hypothetical protein